MKRITSQIATCFTCGKSNEEYKGERARKWAYHHAKTTGHHVNVETVSSIVYNGKT